MNSGQGSIVAECNIMLIASFIPLPRSGRSPTCTAVPTCCKCFSMMTIEDLFYCAPPRWGAADAEIKVPSGENTELKRSPFIAWSRSVYSHTCYAYCQGFLPCLFLPFQSIHLHFFRNLSRFFPVLALANTGSCVGPQNKIGQPA